MNPAPIPPSINSPDPDPPTRSEAQRRSDEIRMFRTELARLEAAGVVQLSAAQAQAISACHDSLLAGFAAAFDIDRDAGAHRLSLGMRAASFLGALALAASVFFLIQQFWGRFAETGQVLILLGASLGSLGLTVWIQGRDASGYFTKLTAMVTFTCFVLNLAMLGRIFNLTPSDQVLLPWAALAFVLAYACELRLLLAAGIACVIAYFSVRVGELGGLYWLDAGRLPENHFPVGLLLLAFPMLFSQRRYAGFASTYRVFGLLCLLLPILILGHWGGGSYLNLDPVLIERGYQLAGFVVSALVMWIGVQRGWHETTHTGIVFFAIFLYTKFFDWYWDSLPKWLFFLILGSLSVLILSGLVWLRRRRKPS